MTEFIHLNIHSEFSIVDGIVRVDDLAQATTAAHMWGVAITDKNNLFAAVKFYQAALSKGLKPILGCEIALTNEQMPNQPFALILLCQNQIGYRNLTELISKAYVEGQVLGKPQINRTWLEAHSAGLIALSGGIEGDIGQALLAGHSEQAQALLLQWQQLFPDRFYLELHRTGQVDEEDYIQGALELAVNLKVPVVATNKVRFLKANEFEAHEVRVCINQGRTLDDASRPKIYTNQQYLRTPAQMAELFSDIPEALKNTVEIAKRCNFKMTLGKTFLPNFPIPNGASPEVYLATQASQGLEANLKILMDTSAPDFIEKRKPYDERLITEMSVINKMGFAGYFLIVADFIRWSRENGIPVGPGRGSGAGSLVAYSLGITDLDPLSYDLLFERFLNPERVSMPDFDVDFCMEGRDRVIEYVSRTYGRESVSQIITYGTMAAKAVVRDVGRVFAHPYGFVDKIAKLIPFEIGMTLDKALNDAEELKKRYNDEEEVRELLDMARKLEGITRNAGKHAGGVVIAPSKLTDFVPMYCEENDPNWVTQFDKDDVEAIGLVKFDFLGLRTLTIIDNAVQSINQQIEKPIDIRLIPLIDPITFDLLKKCATTAVFQLESRGMKDLIKRLQPDCFEDIIALVALFRPGPLQSGMVDDFIDRKHGREPVNYFHEDLTNTLKPTYGVILYQEQVMQIAQVLAGYTLGSADILRRAMGKKKPEEMAKQRAYFIDGAVARQVNKELATQIFDLMEKFAGYGFNKSHSAAYALLAYQTAWLKAHYPEHFMAAVLSADMDNTDKVVTFIDECRQMGLKVLPPNVNISRYKFVVSGVKEICYGLGAIKGAGEAAIEIIVQSREQGGPFTDLFDFCSRLDLRKVNRRVLEALIRAGAMDGFNISRASLIASLETALQAAEQHAKAQASKQADLFGNTVAHFEVSYTPAPDWSKDLILQGEKETLGLYLSGHPIERYQKELAHFAPARIVDLHPRADQIVMVAGFVIGLRVLPTKRGGRMAFITLDDGSARIEIAVFSDVFEIYQRLLVKDALCVIEGEVSMDEYSGGYRMSAKRLFDIEAARRHFGKYVRLRLQANLANPEFLQRLQQIVQTYRSPGLKMVVEYCKDKTVAILPLGSDWHVSPSDALLNALRELAGEEAVAIAYA